MRICLGACALHLQSTVDTLFLRPLVPIKTRHFNCFIWQMMLACMHEYKVTGIVAKGNIDFALLLKGFAIPVTVVEAGARL